MFLSVDSMVSLLKKCVSARGLHCDFRDFVVGVCAIQKVINMVTKYSGV